MKKGILLSAFALPVLLLASCSSIKKSAIRSVSEMLSSPNGAGAFTADDDPQLIADALPLALKLYEILLGMDPENADLAVATGQNFIIYSAGFVQIPADMAEDDEWEEAAMARQRAKKLFRRGRNYILDALELRHEGFKAALEAGDYDLAMAMLDEKDADAAYWAGAGWLGMASVDPFDFELAATLDKAALLLSRSLELNPEHVGLHGLMIQVHLSLPSAILSKMTQQSPNTRDFLESYYFAAGVDDVPKNRALYHYYRSLNLSGGSDPAPHITMATAVSVKEQDVDGFRKYLDAVLELDPESYPDDKLMIVIYQEKARWLLEHIEDYFLVDF